MNIIQHITISKEPGRFTGWPANYGLWSGGDEIVVGIPVSYIDVAGGFHARDKRRPFVAMQARSLDGGQTWQVQETPCRTPGDRGLSADEHMRPELGVGQALQEEGAPVPCPGGIDFKHPDFAMMCARSGLRTGATSWFYTSFDRCRRWAGPFSLPMFDQTGIAARTDYLISGPEACLIFLTAAKANGDEGRVFCAEMTAGGQTIDFVSYIGPEPAGFTIMPASLRLSDTRVLVAMRCKGGRDEFTVAPHWIDLYASDDNGRTWDHFNRPVENTGQGGNPPTLTKLQDGRLCLTYGYRAAPYGIRAQLSPDDGATWGEEIILRADGGNHDIGYPRTVQRPDGALVTVYYYNDRPDGERYIAATLWRPE